MAPPGRRRTQLSFLSILLVGILFFSHTATAASSVLGIDLGTEYIKAVLVKPGTPLEIVLSKDSKRKEPSIISFKPSRGKVVPAGSYPERSYGSAAQALAARFPGDVYPNLKQLLGLPAADSSVVKEYKLRYPALELVSTEPRGTAAFKSQCFKDQPKPFAVEELLAMELKNVVANAQELAGKGHNVQTVVFTVPPFYTTEEKSALGLAANLAGLKVLSVITDGLAVGLNYATSRKFESKPETHMVVDVGAGYTSATVLKMQGISVKDVGKYNKTIQDISVLGTGWDRTLGGDALNWIIAQDVAEKFVESPAGKKLGKTAQDVLNHGRASSRIWKDVEKLRQVLSANQEAGAGWEELFEDVDFKYRLKRADFEAKTEFFTDRLAETVNKALKNAGLTADQLDSIILHGGAIRTPFVQKKLESLVGDSSKLRSNVNSDEAAVFGAAFRAASLSPNFRVKEIRISDATAYPTWLEYREGKGGKAKQEKIFTKSSFTGETKTIVLPHKEDFELYLFQNRPTDKGSPFESGSTGVTGSRFLSKNLVGSVDKLVKDFSCTAEGITTEVTLRLDPIWGLPEVTGGTVSCQHEVPDKSGVMDGVKDFLGFGKKEEDQKVVKGDKKASSSSSSSSSAKADPSEAAKDAKKEEPKPKKVKIKTETVKFSFTTTRDEGTIIPTAEQKSIADRIRSFDSSDQARIQRENDLNNLEAFTYKARDLIEDGDFTSFANSDMIKSIQELSKSTSDWLSDEGADAASEILKEKLKSLKGLVNPIQQRKSEAAKRPEMTELVRSAMNQAKTLLEVMRQSIAAASKIAENAAAEASKTAAEEASKASEAAASASADPLAELEEDPASSSSTSSSKKAKASSDPALYTQEELSTLADAYEAVNDWLEKKIAEQDTKKPWEEPSFKTGELQAKTKELNDAVGKLLRKKLNYGQYGGSGGSKSWSSGQKEKAQDKAKEALKKAREEAKKRAAEEEAKASSATDKVKEEASKATEAVKEAVKEDIKDEL